MALSDSLAALQQTSQQAGQSSSPVGTLLDSLFPQNPSQSTSPTDSGIHLFGGSAKGPDPAEAIAGIEAELAAINFQGSLGNRKDVGAFVEGSPLFAELNLAIELADRRDTLLGKKVQNRGTFRGPNTIGERAGLIKQLVEGGNIKSDPETSIQKEQRLQESLIESKASAQAVEAQERSEIITARAAGPQTLFKREGEIPRAKKLGGGRRD